MTDWFWPILFIAPMFYLMWLSRQPQEPPFIWVKVKRRINFPRPKHKPGK